MSKRKNKELENFGKFSLAWNVISSHLDECSDEEWGMKSSGGRRTIERLQEKIKKKLKQDHFDDPKTCQLLVILYKYAAFDD